MAKPVDLLRKFREDYLEPEDYVDTGERLPWPVGTIVSTVDCGKGYHDQDVVIAHPTVIEVMGTRNFGVNYGYGYSLMEECNFIGGGGSYYFGPVEDPEFAVKRDPLLADALRKVKQLKIPEASGPVTTPQRSSRLGSYMWAASSDDPADPDFGHDYEDNPQATLQKLSDNEYRYGEYMITMRRPSGRSSRWIVHVVGPKIDSKTEDHGRRDEIAKRAAISIDLATMVLRNPSTTRSTSLFRRIGGA